MFYSLRCWLGFPPQDLRKPHLRPGVPPLPFRDRWGNPLPPEFIQMIHKTIRGWIYTIRCVRLIPKIGKIRHGLIEQRYWIQVTQVILQELFWGGVIDGWRDEHAKKEYLRLGEEKKKLHYKLGNEGGIGKVQMDDIRLSISKKYNATGSEYAFLSKDYRTQR